MLNDKDFRQRKQILTEGNDRPDHVANVNASAHEYSDPRSGRIAGIDEAQTASNSNGKTALKTEQVNGPKSACGSQMSTNVQSMNNSVGVSRVINTVKT